MSAAEMRAGSEKLHPVERGAPSEPEEARLRRAILESWRARLREGARAHGEAGKVFFEGRWLTPAQARSAYRDLRGRHRRTLLEVLLLFAGLIGCGLLGWALTYLLCCA